MIRNVHERWIGAPPAEVGRLLATLASDDDLLWPAGWPPIRFDGPPQVGAQGGHGPVRYAVEEWAPDRRIVLRFDPSMGLDGTHHFDVEPRDGGTVLRHTLTARPSGRAGLQWALVLRWLHEALLEELLDRAEGAFGPVATPARTAPWVRVLRAARSRRNRRPRAVPAGPELVAAARLARPDFADAFAVPVPATASLDARDWHAALGGAATPRWVAGLLGLRHGLARVLRLRTAVLTPDRELFPLLHASAGSVTAGLDDRHLDFRIVLLVRPAGTGRELVLATVVQRHNTLGRAYFALIRPFHARIVPSVLRRLAAAGTSGDPVGNGPRVAA